MIKVIAAAIKHPTNRSLEDFQRYWAEHHGHLGRYYPHMRRYVQHVTLLEAYGGTPAPTYDGVSMFWYDSLDSLVNPPDSPRLADAIPPSATDDRAWFVDSRSYGDPTVMTVAETVMADDRQLFDRSTSWPTADRKASVIADERVILEGGTRPEMVKAVLIAARKPGLTVAEFQQHWVEDHAQLLARLPGLRRLVQNPGLSEAYGSRPMTHDGFSELWFDDLPSFYTATGGSEWEAVESDSADLFAEPVGLVLARERVQREIGE